MRFRAPYLAWIPLFFLSLPTDSWEQGLERIDQKTILRDIHYLASEECAGRDTPSPGLNRAAEYIARQFQAAGLEPGGQGAGGTDDKKSGDVTAYFRYWGFQTRATSPQASLVLEEVEGMRNTFLHGVDFHAVDGSPAKAVQGEPVFLGYGIEAKPHRYNDYSKIKPRGKIVLAFAHEPREKRKGKIFQGPVPTTYSSIYQKAKTAEKYGAAGLLVVTGPIYHEGGKPVFFHRRRARMCTKAFAGQIKIPVMTISLEVAEKIAGRELRSYQEQIDKSLKSKPLSFPGKRITMKAEMERIPVDVPNVVAFKKGSHPLLSREVVILGAHYDHVGVDDSGVMWPGADDNASGTSVLMEVARSIAQTPTERTICFVAFSGEEIGLLGSQEYANDPLFPNKDTVAMINMDMVGRGKPKEFFVVGSKKNPDMEKFFSRALKKKRLGLKVQRDEKFFTRSDHYNFFKKGIPVLFFIGVKHEHDDYHCPGDTPDLIVAKKVENCAKMIFLLTYELGTHPSRPSRPDMGGTR